MLTGRQTVTTWWVDSCCRRVAQMETVKVAIEGVVIEAGQIGVEDIPQGGALHPFGHGVFGAGGNEAIEGHDPGQLPGNALVGRGP